MFVRPPLNYTGNKFKYLYQIVQCFSSKIDLFVEPFCGSCSASLNVHANMYICNDLCSPLIAFYTYLQQTPEEQILETIHSFIKKFNLSKTNKEGFGKLRTFYNKEDAHPLAFFLLVCSSFNNFWRFNRNEEFNVSFGKRCYNYKLQNRLLLFIKSIKEKDWFFTNQHYSKLTYLDSNAFVYLDPPYRNTTTTYMRGWDEKEDKTLCLYVDFLHRKNIKFALSCTFKSNGENNAILQKLISDYIVIDLVSSYSNTIYHQKSRKKTKDKEVLIINYELPKRIIQESFG